MRTKKLQRRTFWTKPNSLPRPSVGMKVPVRNIGPPEDAAAYKRPGRRRTTGQSGQEMKAPGLGQEPLHTDMTKKCWGWNDPRVTYPWYLKGGSDGG